MQTYLFSISKSTDTSNAELHAHYRPHEMIWPQIKHVVTKHVWAPAVFVGGKRGIKNFSSAQIIGVDVDSGMSVAQAVEVVKSKNLSAIIGATRNHMKDKDGLTCERFRVLFRMSRSVKNSEQYRKTIKDICRLFPTADTSCQEPSRFFFPCREILHSQDGIDIEPVPYEPTQAQIAACNVRKLSGSSPHFIRMIERQGFTVAHSGHKHALAYAFFLKDMCDSAEEIEQRMRILKNTRLDDREITSIAQWAHNHGRG